MKTASQKIDEMISELDDWRHDTFSEIRRIIRAAAPEITEEWKYMGTPVWYHDGMMLACANPLKDKVKLTFQHGASLPDPQRLFNAGFDGNQRRAIDFFEKDTVKKGALKALVLAAISYNSGASKKSKAKSKSGRSRKSGKAA